MEEKISNFRKAYINLPDEIKTREVMRLYSIVNNKPYIVLEDHDIGKVLKFLDVSDLMEYLWREKQVKVDDSYIYKVLKGRYTTAKGYRIYYEEIE